MPLSTKKQAGTAVHRNAHVQYSSVDSSSCSFQVQKHWASLRTRLSSHKCMVENWWSLTIEVATDAEHCVELLNMFSKKVSSKLVRPDLLDVLLLELA